MERIENSQLWQRYAHRRADMTAQLDLEDRVRLSRFDSAADWQRALMLGAERMANEVMLFHGTQSAALDAILLEGLDPRVSGAGLFGNGLYFAENASKSDEYTGKPADGLHRMFLSRVVLGRPYVHTGNKPWPSFSIVLLISLLRLDLAGRASETRVQVFKDGPKNPLGTLMRGPYLEEYGRPADSLWHQRGGQNRPWKHAELVVYDRTQTYPEFLITYRRIEPTSGRPIKLAHQ